MSDRIRALVAYDPLTGLFTRKSGNGKGGGLNAFGYVQINVAGKFYLGHRLAWWFVHGELPTGELDHVNGNKSDNRIANLRLATRPQNAANMKKHRTGLKGVYWNALRQTWHAQICVCYVKHHLGTFATEQDAYAAYCEAARRLHGEFARFD